MTMPVLLWEGAAVDMGGENRVGLAILTVSGTDLDGRAINGFFCFETPEGAIRLQPIVEPFCRSARVIAEMPDGTGRECRLVISNGSDRYSAKMLAESPTIKARWS